MQSDLWQRRFGWTCLAAIILCSGALAQVKHAAADDANPQLGQSDVNSMLAQAPTDGFRIPPEMMRQFQQDLSADRETGKYWLGVECHEAQPELRTQLGLKDDVGLAVVHVAEDGPASKVGIKQHDVIVAAGDINLSRPSDLVKAVNAADGKELSLKIIRAGKEQTVTVKPAERPQSNSRIIARPGTGFLFPGGPHVDLPDDVTITIVHHGKDPGRITVTRGVEKWEITDLELGKLPEDLRSLVGRTIGVGPALPFGGDMNPNGFRMPPGMRVEGLTMGPPGSNPPPPPRDGGPPSRDEDHRPGDGNPPPRDGNGPSPRDSNGPPRDGMPTSHSQSGGPDGRNGFLPPDRMPPEQMFSELMQRLDILDQRLNTLQNELQRLHDGGPEGGPRMRGKGPDDVRNGPPGGGPPNDGDRRGPPPGTGRQGPPDNR